MTKSTERSFPAVLHVAHDAIVITDLEQNILFFNQSAERVFGYRAKDVIGKKLALLLPLPFVDIHNRHFRKFSRGRRTSKRMNEKREVSGRHEDGTIFPAEASISKFKEAGETFFSVNLRDITESKQAEDHLRLVTERFKLATESAHIGVWDLDLRTNQTYWDDRQFEIYGLKREKAGVIRYETWAERVHPEDLPDVEVKPDREFADESLQFGFRIIRPDGSIRYIQSAEAVVRDGDGIPVRLVGINMDVTDAKEVELERSKLLHDLGERVKELTVLHNAARLFQSERPLDRGFLAELTRILPPGWQYPDICKAQITYMGIKVAAPGWQDTSWKQTATFETSEGEGIIEIVYLAERPTKDEGPFLIEERALLESFVEMLEVHLKHLHAVKGLYDREMEFRTIFENSGIGMALVDLNGRLVTCNPQLEEFLGYTRDELTVMTFAEFTHPDDVGADLQLFQALIANERDRYTIEKRYIRKNGQVIWGRLTASLVKSSDGVPRFGVGMVEDVTARKEAEEKNIRLFQEATRRLNNVQALRLIDTAIASNMELRLILNIVLEQALLQLEMDAGAILLRDLPVFTLKFAAGRGFQGKDIESSNVRLGEGHAGQSAQRHELVIIPDLMNNEANFSRAQLLEDEKFIFHAVAPLIVKGESKGVIEVFKRSRYDPSSEWLDFFTTLAGQTSISLDNSAMFAGLQQSNTSLIAAYDETLEGWSRAMDFRDKETEGHTQRVTAMTLKLAFAMGIRDNELVHIRRGSLLHDIGKVGVPDTILLKPDTLTPDEWAVMRRHPEIAYEMLSPIRFLQKALDIPYCHHEKWDGTGYPRGLKGEQIPLSARIFAIVDVWDALRSDRPYRKGWPEDKVLAHIQSLSGSHFDPQGVKAFLDLVDKDTH